MTEVVSDDMVERATAVLDRAIGWRGEFCERITREAIDAALNPPEDRACLCGCPHERQGNSQFYVDACRTRHWKEETGYVKPSTRSEENGGNASEVERLRPRRPGGLQVAFGPAVSAWTAYLASATPLSAKEARKVAVRVTMTALSAKQRERARRARVREFREAA